MRYCLIFCTSMSVISVSAALSSGVWISMFSNLLCGNVDLQKLIKLLTAAVSTVRIDTVRSFGKPVIQSVF